MEELILEFPDGVIKKKIVKQGVWGTKPTENCECCISVSEDLEELASDSLVTIGNGNTSYERLLDECLKTMFIGEVASVIYIVKYSQKRSCTLKLVSFHSNGLLYEWTAVEKCELALKHKDEGFRLFNESKFVDASHRFGRGLKILCSIPIPVDETLTEIDGIKLETINHLKAILYNNLAACYLKHSDYETVLVLCPKVLQLDSNNVKALYKEAVAKCNTHDYEGSQTALQKLLVLDPNNRAASEKLKYVNIKLAESNEKFNAIVRKMFEK